MSRRRRRRSGAGDDAAEAEEEDEDCRGEVGEQRVELERHAGREEGDVDGLGRVVEDAEEGAARRREVDDDEAGDHRDHERLVQRDTECVLLRALSLKDLKATCLQEKEFGTEERQLGAEPQRGDQSSAPAVCGAWRREQRA